MRFRWPFGRNAAPPPDADVEEAESLQGRDDDFFAEDKEAPSGGRKRRAILIGGLVLAMALAAWLRWSSGPALRAPGDPASNPLLAVRPIVPPVQGPAEPKAAPEAKASGPSDLSSRQGDRPVPERPAYFAPLPPPSASPPDSVTAPDEKLAAMGWDLALKDRESRLAELDWKQKELQAKSKEAEARIEEAEAWIRAIRKTPQLALRSGDRSLAIGGKVSRLPPFEVPPPPQGSGPRVVPPKPVEPQPVQPEGTPKASEIFVRMIDGSGPVPEAVVSVGPTAYVVRAGDTLGSWQVTAIGPNGIWIKGSPNERVWRPLLVRGTIRAEPSSLFPGFPAASKAHGEPK